MKDILAKAYQEEQNRLGTFIRSKISNAEDAEDILQDVFYSVMNNINVLQSIDNLIGYLYVVTKNKITDWYRKKKLNTVSLHNEENEHLLEELVEDVFEDIEDDYERTMIEDEIIKAINELPKDQKDVFVANEIEGVSFKQLSEKMNISINTLLARKRYAVLNLREKLKRLKEAIEED